MYTVRHWRGLPNRRLMQVLQCPVASIRYGVSSSTRLRWTLSALVASEQPGCLSRTSSAGQLREWNCGRAKHFVPGLPQPPCVHLHGMQRGSARPSEVVHGASVGTMSGLWHRVQSSIVPARGRREPFAHLGKMKIAAGVVCLSPVRALATPPSRRGANPGVRAVLGDQASKRKLAASRTAAAADFQTLRMAGDHRQRHRTRRHLLSSRLAATQLDPIMGCPPVRTTRANSCR